MRSGADLRGGTPLVSFNHVIDPHFVTFSSSLYATIRNPNPNRNSLISGEVSYTGWTLSTGFRSESAASRCSDVCTRWFLNTCRVSIYCQPVSSISGRRHLRSADRGHLDFPRVKLASYRGRSFAYAGPSN